MSSEPSSTAQRGRNLLLNLIPSLLLLGLVALTIWGNQGLLEWYHLRREVAAEQAVVAGLQRDNALLMRRVQVIDADPVQLERLVAEELGRTAEGGVIYQFEE